jgi:hypothetical protein
MDCLIYRGNVLLQAILFAGVNSSYGTNRVSANLRGLVLPKAQ